MDATAAGPRIGLVLGAGGVAGAAWHAGVLAALAEVTGWDARRAPVLVGTSAGSGTAAALRVGTAPADLFAGATGGRLSPEAQARLERAGGPVSIPVPTPRPRIPVPASPRLALQALLDLDPSRPLLPFAGLLPAGRVPTGFIGDRVRATLDGRWPEAPTWICAVRLSDGARVVFGRDVHDAHLATAVEASSAIPGWFAPVAHAGEDHVDGAVHSPTNADLLAGHETPAGPLDLVVVSSPMSATRDAVRRLRWTGARGLHASRLADEVRQVRDAGTPVLVLQPDRDVVDVIGMRTMDPERRPVIARTAHASVTAHLRSGAVDDRLAVLAR